MKYRNITLPFQHVSPATLFAVVSVITLRSPITTSPSASFFNPSYHDDAENIPFPPPRLHRYFYLLPIFQRYDIIQKLEQGFELFELSIFFLAKVGQLVRVFLADRCVEFGECIACRDVSDWSTLQQGHAHGRRQNERNRTHRKDVLHQQFQRPNLVIVHRLGEVQPSQDLTQHLLVLLYITVVINTITAHHTPSKKDATIRTFYIIFEQRLENVLCQIKMHPVVDRLALHVTMDIISRTSHITR